MAASAAPPPAALLLDGEPTDQVEIDAVQATAVVLSAEELGGSLATAFEAKLRAFAARPCLGRRGGEPADARWAWTSYGSFLRRSRQLSLALASELPPGALVGVCGANSLAWFTLDFACLWAGFGTVPLSDTWDLHTLELVLEKCGVAAAACDGEHLPKMRALKRPVWLATLDGGADEGPPSEAVASVEDLIGREWPERPVVARAPDAVHTILHTSGTTGLPKGVVYSDGLWRRNMVAYEGMNVGYSYMPLAYITDRHTVCTNLWNGGRVGIRTPGSTDEIFRDLQQVRPTVLKGVPAFFEKVRAAAQLVQDRSLELLGGRCALLICGAGALDLATAEWFRGCKVQGRGVAFLEMYGGTECGNLAVNRRLQPGVEYKLLPYGDLPEGYGELVVKTGCMFSGYYNEPEKTAAAFTSDGYYQIGDLVHIEDGRVTVIGRAKTSIKLGNGKWVFPESLEDLYRSKLNKLGVRQIYVHGDAHHDVLLAVVDAEDGVDVAGLVPKLRVVAEEAGRQSYEHIAAAIPAYEAFTREAGTLNGTGKLDRKNLLSIYGPAMDAEFQRLAEEAARAALSSLDSGQSFRAQGGTSLQAGRIASLYLDLGVPISRVAKLLLSDAPVMQVAEELAAANPAADAQAELTIASMGTGGQAAEGERCVLLTGATGFLGRFVLADLLARGTVVVSLVRARDELQGKQRLRKALVDIGRWRESWWPRVLVSLGSLTRPFELAEGRRVTAVIHAGAVVNLKGSYEFHRSANVLGTLHVLQLASKIGARVVFVSTTDTYKTREEAEACSAEPSPEVLSDKKHGYASSKAVGEALVASAIRQGLSACTVRLGMVAGDTKTGFCNPTDFALRLIIGISHARSFPVTTERHTMVHSLPVDVAAAALGDLAESTAVGAVNLVSGAPLLPMSELREQLLRFGGSAFGDLPLLPFPEWMERLRAEAQLSAWPVLGWAAGQAEFPVFNTRCPGEPPGDWASPETRLGLERGVDEACLHGMLRFAFVAAPRPAARKRLQEAARVAFAGAKFMALAAKHG